MKVKELKDMLSQYPDDMEVEFYTFLKEPLDIIWDNGPGQVIMEDISLDQRETRDGKKEKFVSILVG